MFPKAIDKMYKNLKNTNPEIKLDVDLQKQ